MTVKPKKAPRIIIRHSGGLRDWRVTCAAPLCKFDDKSDEMGAQRLARKHNNDNHGGTLIVKFENQATNRARERALDHTSDD